MHLGIQFLLVTLLVGTSAAEERLMEGGRSPNGNCEVRIEGHDTTFSGLDGHEIHLYRTKPAMRIFTLPGIGGYLDFKGANERDQVYWHSSNRFVAITDQGSRHSVELYILAISEGKVTILNPPDFYQNALGRIDALELDFASSVTAQKWNGDDLPLKLNFTANGRHSYRFEVVLHLNHGEGTTPSLSLKGVKQLRDEKD